MVISTIGIPPRVTASAAKCASWADEDRIAGMIPIFSIWAQTSFFVICMDPSGSAVGSSAAADRALTADLQLIRHRSGPLDNFSRAGFRQVIAAPREPNIQRRQ